MQFLSVIPEQVESAAQDLAGIRSALSASYAAAAGPTTAVVSAAEDEVSTAIASIFGAYGRQCQVLSAQASAFHDEFVNLLKTGATAYRNTEFANAQSNVLNAVNAPARSLLGHPSAAESVQNSAPTLGGGHSTVTAGLAAQAGRAVATVEQQAAAAVAPLPSAGAGLAQVVNGVVTSRTGFRRQTCHRAAERRALAGQERRRVHRGWAERADRCCFAATCRGRRCSGGRYVLDRRNERCYRTGSAHTCWC